jgi:RimJ/RimL family protein N-acetyltransferase
VKEWHSLSADEWTPQDLADVVKTMLSVRVTRSLPTAWQGAYTVERAHEWIKERDREGATLLAVERSSQLPAGLVILFEECDHGVDGAKVRLGYLLAESAWGKGMASELVRGFVGWCRKAGVSSIVGGVERDNAPSRRVLEKNGFVCDPGTEGAAEQLFELRLRPD